VKRSLPGGLELDDDAARIDVDAVHRFLSEESYWARGRTREQLDALHAASDRLVGLYAGQRQLGFSRAVRCEGAGLAYLADVYVLPAYRGRGLGLELVRFSVEEGPLARLRWLLHTDDAHSLYAKFGFAPSPRLLERPAR
jgi:GNAT superfamily N-acetyltransferase